jgi:2'-5' RNA ligase
LITAALRPSTASALVIVVSLPPPLEALRLRSIGDAAAGLPAHVTLLYPFAEEAQIDAAVVAAIDRIAERHHLGTLTLRERRRFPATLYASVDPDGPIRALQAELAGAFPTLPLYGGEHAFEPHVSVVEGRDLSGSDEEADRAWDSLPVTLDVAALDLITRRNGRWGSRRRFDLARVRRR